MRPKVIMKKDPNDYPKINMRVAPDFYRYYQEKTETLADELNVLREPGEYKWRRNHVFQEAFRRGIDLMQREIIERRNRKFALEKR